MGAVVSGSVITSNGQLTPNFEYIADLRAANEAKTNVIPGDFNSEKKVSFTIILKNETSITHFLSINNFCFIVKVKILHF